MKATFFPISFMCILCVLWNLHFAFLQVGSFTSFCLSISFTIYIFCKFCNFYLFVSSSISYLWIFVFELMCMCSNVCCACRCDLGYIGQNLKGWGLILPQISKFYCIYPKFNLLALLVAKIVHKILYVC